MRWKIDLWILENTLDNCRELTRFLAVVCDGSHFFKISRNVRATLSKFL